MVHQGFVHACCYTKDTCLPQQPSKPAFSSRSSSTGQKATGPEMLSFRLGQSLRENGLSPVPLSWLHGSTKKQYDIYLRKWLKFCSESNCSEICATVADVINFLTSLFSQSLGYSAINTARCALSAFLHSSNCKTIGTDPLISRFLKGVFELRPPTCRYTQIWDVSVVLQYLRKLIPLEKLSLNRQL